MFNMYIDKEASDNKAVHTVGFSGLEEEGFG